jgi:hypothetical protein
MGGDYAAAHLDGRHPASAGQNQLSVIQFAEMFVTISTKPFCIGFPGAMKCQPTIISLHHASMVAGELGAIVADDMPRLPRRSMIAFSSRATRRPEIEVSGIAPRQSLVTSGRCSKCGSDRHWRTGRGQNPATARVGVSFDQDRRSRLGPCGVPDVGALTGLLPDKAMNTVDTRGLAFPPQQDKRPPLAKPSAFVSQLAKPRPQVHIRRPARSVANPLLIRADDAAGPTFRQTHYGL